MAFEVSGQRLHPISILFGAAKVARMLILPAILMVFANRGDGDAIWSWIGWLWAVVSVVFVAGASVLGYLFYRVVKS